VASVPFREARLGLTDQGLTEAVEVTRV